MSMNAANNIKSATSRRIASAIGPIAPVSRIAFRTPSQFMLESMNTTQPTISSTPPIVIARFDSASFQNGAEIHQGENRARQHQQPDNAPDRLRTPRAGDNTRRTLLVRPGRLDGAFNRLNGE